MWARAEGASLAAAFDGRALLAPLLRGHVTRISPPYLPYISPISPRRHLENASRFGALYAQRARRLLPPAVAGGAPTVAPCTPSARFHYCMACSGSSLERACAATPVEDVPLY